MNREQLSEVFLFKISEYCVDVRSEFRSAFQVVCVSLFLAPIALSQITGSLSGKVHDVSGALVPGAKVTLVDEKSGAKRGTVSNGEGLFIINAVQPDTYDLLVTAKGFETYKVTGIEMHPGDAKTVATIQLKVGELNQEVTVTANAAGVNLESGEKSYLITADDIKRLSTVGRDVTELIKILPGFAASTGGGLQNNSTNSGAQTVGFGTTSTSSFSANGATPQTGATTVISDGASTMDPGDMGASILNVNMDMVAEVKVQTANFGADTAKGPIVINAVGKSGGSTYHGTGYLFARNGALNANDWLANNSGAARPPAEYYFPGGNVGGPVRIPGTNFNHNKKMTFFTGFEYYKQRKLEEVLLSFIPTAQMLSGDLTPGSIGAALHVDPTVVTAQCPNFYTSGSLANSGGFCFSPGLGGLTYTQQDQQIAAGNVVGSPMGLLPVDPRAKIYAKFWPAINRAPQAGNGLASDGYNYVNALTSTHDGYQYRARIDENFTEDTKLYVTYNFEKINDETPVDNTYYAGSDVIPYPTSAFSDTKSNSIALNFTHVFSPTLTNEVVVTGTFFYLPNQLGNRSLVQDATTGWTGGRIYNNGALQLPGLVDYEEGVPDFAMGYFPAGSSYLRKYSYNAADNLSKQWRSHSIKVGFYYENTGNNQVPFVYSQGENAFNHYNSGCFTSPDPITHLASGHVSQLFNNVANFLQGCSGFTQSSSSTPSDLHFKEVDFYATDDWKVNSKLTLTIAMRFDHMGPWTDPHGTGLAIWNAPTPHTIFSVMQDPRTFPGISWHGTNSSIPLSGAPDRLLFYLPRFGVAYDMYGNGRTVFRGGIGAYRFHDSYNDSAGALNTSIGIQNYATPPNLSCTYDQLTATANLGSATPMPGVDCFSGAAGSGTSPFTLYALDAKDNEQPLNYSYSFSVDQVMPGRMNLEASYVGNQSSHTFTEGNLSNQNYIPLGGLFQPDPITGAVTVAGSSAQNQQDYRPFPNYSQVFVPHHIGYGNYNSLQVSLNKQKGGLIYGVNYTWAKALGIRGDYRTGAVGDPSTLRNNYGYLGFNRNHAVNATYSYQVGDAYHGNRVLRQVLNQWEISGTTSVQSGPDVAVLNGTTNTNFNLGGGLQYTPPGGTSPTMVALSNVSVLGTPDINLQPVITCNPKSGFAKNPIYGHQYINGACFALPKLGTNGSFEMPDIHGPALIESDLTVQRTFKLNERQNMQFRLAGFNFLNHPLAQFYGGAGAPVALSLGFGNPAGSATTPQQAIAAATMTTANFGYTPYKTGYRIVEVSARYNF
jgi:Carboxypeptidase regulatory-like domain